MTDIIGIVTSSNINDDDQSHQDDPTRAIADHTIVTAAHRYEKNRAAIIINKPNRPVAASSASLLHHGLSIVSPSIIVCNETALGI